MDFRSLVIKDHSLKRYLMRCKKRLEPGHFFTPEELSQADWEIRYILANKAELLKENKREVQYINEELVYCISKGRRNILRTVLCKDEDDPGAFLAQEARERVLTKQRRR